MDNKTLLATIQSVTRDMGYIMPLSVQNALSGKIMEQYRESTTKLDFTKSSQTSLKRIKEHLKENFEEGCECPACGQNVKLYTRKITSAMAYGLILLVNSEKTEFFHVENYLKEQDCPSSIRGDISKLRHFGLIERLDVKREDGSNRAGYYRVTDKGRKFVNKEVKVEKAVKIFNNYVYGYVNEMIDIEEALGQKFNYGDLMNGRI